MSTGRLGALGPAVGWRRFFQEDYFWKQANIGPFFWALLLTPFAYGAVKSAYYTRQLRELNRREVISDRYDWLHKALLDDEVERIVRAKQL